MNKKIIIIIAVILGITIISGGGFIMKNAMQDHQTVKVNTTGSIYVSPITFKYQNKTYHAEEMTIGKEDIDNTLASLFNNNILRQENDDWYNVKTNKRIEKTDIAKLLQKSNTINIDPVELWQNTHTDK